MENIKTRNFRFLLYSDNKDMMYTFKHIQRDSQFSHFYVGIWHTLGKKHSHIVMQFQNPRSWKQLCSDLKIDERFCRPIGYEEDNRKDKKGTWRKSKYDTLENALAYLTHSNSPDKEQYSTNQLFGCSAMKYKAIKSHNKALSALTSQGEALLAVRKWIVSHYGDIITPMMFVGWIVDTPYMKVVNSPWVRNMIDAHNQAVYSRELKQNEDIDFLRALYERRKQAQLDAEFECLEEWTPLF